MRLRKWKTGQCKFKMERWGGRTSGSNNISTSVGFTTSIFTSSDALAFLPNLVIPLIPKPRTPDHYYHFCFVWRGRGTQKKWILELRGVFPMIRIEYSGCWRRIGRKYRFEFDLPAWPMCHKIYWYVKRLEGLTTRLEFHPQAFNCLNNSCAGFSWRLDLDDYVVMEVPIGPLRLNRRDNFYRRIIEKPAR